jgi:hypothetical protein
MRPFERHARRFSDMLHRCGHVRSRQLRGDVVRRVRSRSVVLVAGIAVAGVSLASAPSASAAAATWNGALASGTHRVSHLSAPSPQDLDLHLPVLKGADALDRRIVSRWVSKTVSGQVAMVGSWRAGLISAGGCNGPDVGRGDIYADHTTAVLAKKYFTTAVAFISNPGCGGVNEDETAAAVWDLAAHRQLSILDIAARPFHDGAYITLEDSLWSTVMGTSLVQCLAADTFTTDRHMVRRFSLTRRGIALHINRYEGGFMGACGTREVVIPWRSIRLTARGAAIAKFYGFKGAPDRPLAGD